MFDTLGVGWRIRDFTVHIARYLSVDCPVLCFICPPIMCYIQSKSNRHHFVNTHTYILHDFLLVVWSCLIWIRREGGFMSRLHCCSLGFLCMGTAVRINLLGAVRATAVVCAELHFVWRMDGSGCACCCLASNTSLSLV